MLKVSVGQHVRLCRSPAVLSRVWPGKLASQQGSRVAMSAASSIFHGPGAEELRARSHGQCSSSTPLLGKPELDDGMKALPAWALNSEGTMISRKFVAKNFVAAIKFFEDVSKLAEEANHHPDLHLTGYRNVEVVLSTHAIGGLAEVDLVMAARIDALDVDYSLKWLKQQEAHISGASS